MLVQRGLVKQRKLHATKRQKLKQHLTDKKFLRNDWTIHQERCEVDPMYQLLFFPNHKLNLTDENGNVVEEITFIDRILSESIRLLMERNKGFIEKSACIKNAFSFLQSDLADSKCKLFALMFMARKIRPIRDVLESLYDPNINPKDPWGSARFVKLIQLVDNWCEMTLNYPYSEKNIVTIVRNFCTAILHTYMMGS